MCVCVGGALVPICAQHHPSVSVATRCQRHVYLCPRILNTTHVCCCRVRLFLAAQALANIQSSGAVSLARFDALIAHLHFALRMMEERSE